METILKQFVNEPLFDACAAMLNYLHITFNEVTRTPVPFDGLYPGPLTKALQEIMAKVEHTYFIGTIDEASLSGHAMQQDEDEVTQKAAEGKYVGMMIFAVNIINGQTLTRTEMATLTRGFNRIAAAQPVVLFIKQGDRLALSTCERSEYTQQWRDGEKLGKVSMLRNIKCLQPHRGHIDILESIGDKAYPNFEELYKHWMQVFSSELLTRKFYGELSDWYAWAVQVARFPNDLTTTEDDEQFNHESCIRLITRLIFVWFLKQKHLIPEEFFDEDYIREHFIEEFDPHARKTMFYDAERSKYYRLILQNLFFAMLNRPIVPEGKDTPNNRRFRVKGNYHGMNPDYAVNNLLRYEGDFKQGGAEEFLKMANSSVPFLNGGLFDCLDDKPKNLYYDGFSERKESLEQLYLPDWLFFGDEVGRSIDLSQWYGDTKKKSVSARGIIDILKRYNFTIEENTPLDQEVSLDPELLGKAFENLLASYNPETKTSARKQTGSFYTPREIVQYMVDESLVAHLKRICGEDLEPQYRSLLSYTTEETTLTKEQRRNIMQALYNCRVLDPACGSGAFPMGVLQQMVHILRQVDPSNEMWKDFMIDLAIDESRVAFAADEDEERKARLADIEESFDKSINDPDYARKLYLIEHCIFGVDIQPIAVQISKLRFFISLVVDQKPTDDAVHNFGIRPLPNLESKFVAANTLIPVDYDASLFESTDAIISKKEQLKELNHQIFLAKRNIDKQRIKTKIKETRKSLAKAIEDTGFVNPGAAQLLADWDMFEQNTFASFFDAEWMFGVKGGFEIVIGNPPYGATLSTEEKKLFKQIYRTSQTIKNVQKGSLDTYSIFIDKSFNLLSKGGCLTFIVPISLTSSDSLSGVHKLLMDSCEKIYISSYSVRPQPIFENAVVNTSIFTCQRTDTKCQYVYSTKMYRKGKNFNLQYLIDHLEFADVKKYLQFGRIPKVGSEIEISILNKISQFNNVEYFVDAKGLPIYYRTTGGRYFKVVTNYPTGSTKEKPLLLKNTYRDIIGCLLSSNLSFWYYQIYSNNLDWKYCEITSFPIPILDDETIKKVCLLYSEYLLDIEKNANVRYNSGTSKYNVSSFKEYKIGKSKAIIDKIDDLICPLYGLTKEETKYIKEYELEFRMSDDEE
jgi:type I restriction-modification system DNA methylase subunit